MKLKLLLLLITFSFQIFGQQNLNSDSSYESKKHHVKIKRKHHKSIHRTTKTIIADTTQRSNITNNREEEAKEYNNSSSSFLVALVLVGIGAIAISYIIYDVKRNSNSDTFNPDEFISDTIARTVLSRRTYYNDVYLKSDAWQRKRYVVLRRDNWRCVHCGGRATQVHHKRYARKNIGKEPIEWLESICRSCHEGIHQ